MNLTKCSKDDIIRIISSSQMKIVNKIKISHQTLPRCIHLTFLKATALTSLNLMLLYSTCHVAIYWWRWAQTYPSITAYYHKIYFCYKYAGDLMTSESSNSRCYGVTAVKWAMCCCNVQILYLCKVPVLCELSGQSSRCCDGPLHGHALGQPLPRLLHCWGGPDWTDVETLGRMESSLAQQ